MRPRLLTSGKPWRFFALATTTVLGASLLALSAPQSATAAVFTPGNNNDITVANGTGVPTSTLPDVTGAGGFVTSVQITLHGVTDANADDLDVELIAPNGTAVALMSDACQGGSFSNNDLTFTDGAAGPLPNTNTAPCPAPGQSATVRGINYNPSGDNDNWLVPPTSTGLGALDGQNPDGTWRLWVSEDGGNAGDADIANGFSMIIQTGPFQALLPGAGTSGPSNPYPVALPVSNRTGTVTDVNVTLRGLTHSNVSDIDAVLVSPTGTAVSILSDACQSNVSENAVDWTFDDQAAATLPVNGSTLTCLTGSYKPSNFTDADTDTLPSPAPAGPYGTSLSAFNGQNPNGTWRLYLNDDSSATNGTLGSGGYLAGSFVTVTTTTDNPDVTAPDTKITSFPRRTRHHKGSVFTFTSSEANSTFQCKIDRGKWTPCSTPFSSPKLKLGRHRFKVRAIDAAGNIDPSPDRVRWKIFKKHGKHHHEH